MRHSEIGKAQQSHLRCFRFSFCFSLRNLAFSVSLSLSFFAAPLAFSAFSPNDGAMENQA